MKRIFVITVLIFAISLSYAILRYNVFGTVPWSMLPLYIVNKSFAVTGLIMLLIIYLLPLINREGSKWKIIWEERSLFGRLTFVFILLHTVASLLLFKPSVYPKFFNGIDQLNLEGSFSMLAGLLSLVIVWFINKLYQADREHPGEIRQFSRMMLILVIIFIGFHLIFMGYTGWWDYHEWPGSMPPISMVSLLIMIVFVTYYQLKKHA